MGIFEKFTKNGTKLVGSYKGNIKGSALEYSTSEINGIGDGKGFITGGDTINKTITSKSSTLHKEASTLNTPEVKKILTNLYNDIDPTLSLLLPIPRKPFVENNTGPFSVPQLLSIVVGTTDSDSLYGKAPASTALEKGNVNKKLKAEIINHNEHISDIVNIFNEQIDEYKEQDNEMKRKNAMKK